MIKIKIYLFNLKKKKLKRNAYIQIINFSFTNMHNYEYSIIVSYFKYFLKSISKHLTKTLTKLYFKYRFRSTWRSLFDR